MTVPTEAPLSAFGGGQEVAAAYGGAERLGQVVSQIAEKHAQDANQVLLTDIDTKLANHQATVQIQSQNLKGKDALAAPSFALNQWTEGVDKILKGAEANPDVLRAAQATAASRGAALETSVKQHVSGEIETYENQQTSDGLKASQNIAVLNAGDPQAVQRELGQQTALAQQWAKRKGVPTEGPESVPYQEFVRGQHSATYRGIISSALQTGDYKQAKNYYDTAKKTGSFTGADMEYVDHQMEGAEVLDNGNKEWKKVSQYTLRDGQPNESKMLSEVYKNDTYTPEMKEKVSNFIQSKAADQRRMTAQHQENNDRTFMDAAVEAKTNNVPMVTALRMVPQFSRDPYDQAQKEEAIRKMYAPKTESNPTVWRDLYEGVQDGVSTKDDIDKAFARGDINVEDWRSLSKDFHGQITEGKNLPLVEARKRIIAKAEETIDKEDMPNFLKVLDSEGRGKSVEEYEKIADEKLKKTGIFGFRKQAWENDSKRMDESSQAWGQVYSDVGRQQVNAIGASIMRLNKSKNYSINEVDSFVKELGGYEALKTGAPANDAILWLSSNRWPITPKNVQWALEQKKTGAY